MQDLKPKKLICLDKPNNQPEQINAHQTQSNKPNNLQAPNTGTQNIANIFGFIIIAAIILTIATFIISKLNKKAKKIILSIFMLATVAFGSLNSLSKTYAETLIDGKPCQTTGWSDYEVGVKVKVDLEGADYLKEGVYYETTVKFKGTGSREEDEKKVKEEALKIGKDKSVVIKVVKDYLATFNPDNKPDGWDPTYYPDAVVREGNNIRFYKNGRDVLGYPYVDGDKLIENGFELLEEYNEYGQVVGDGVIRPDWNSEKQAYEVSLSYEQPVYVF